jgi:hypothetical protein
MVYGNSIEEPAFTRAQKFKIALAFAGIVGAVTLAGNIERDAQEVEAQMRVEYMPAAEHPVARVVLTNPMACPVEDDKGRALRFSLYCAECKPRRICEYAR